MKMRIGRPDWLRVIRFCYWATFVLLGIAILNVLVGIIDPTSWYFVISTNAIGAAMFLLVIVVNTYPILVLTKMKQAQQTKRFRFGVLSFILLNGLTGYLWFFVMEIKRNKAPYAHKMSP